MAKIYDNKIISVEDILDFGKHNGEEVYYVIYHHPRYIEWCVNTILKFELDKEASDMLEIALFNCPLFCDS